MDPSQEIVSDTGAVEAWHQMTPLTTYTVPAKLVGLFTIEETVEMYKVADVEAHALKWATEKPTVPGLYFYRDSGVPVMGAWVDSLAYHPEELRVGLTNGWHGYVKSFNGEWAGPIVPPQEGA